MLARSRFPLILWLATRIGIVGVAGLSVFLWPFVHGPHGPVAAALSLTDGLCAWDCRAYAQIAAHGYDRAIVANFWPMLPLYARPLVWLHVPPLAAVVLVANAASLVAYVAVYHVFERLDGEAAARSGLALFAAYPFAFFFGVGYTESLMVAAGAGAMWLALSGRHVRGGVALAAGILSRAPATLAWLGLAAVQLGDAGSGPRPGVPAAGAPPAGAPPAARSRPGWRALLGLAIPIAVAALWPLYTWIHFGDPLTWMRVRALWGWHANLSVPAGLVRWRESRMLLVYPVFALVPAAGVVALCAARRYWPLAAIALPTFALFCVMGAFGFGRYTASVWPAFLPLGLWLSRRPSLQVPVLVALALFQGLFLQLFAHAYELQ